jgi:hypothetical protein
VLSLSREMNKANRGSAQLLLVFPCIDPGDMEVPSADKDLGSLFTNPRRRGIVRAVCRLGDLGTAAR